MAVVGVVRDLTELFTWIGFIGAGIAVICALLALVALARGAASVAGGAAAVWIGGAMMSIASGFSGQWMPALIAFGALAAGLAIGGAVRPIVRSVSVQSVSARPRSETVSDAALPDDEAPRAAIGGPALAGSPSLAGSSARSGTPALAGASAMSSVSAAPGLLGAHKASSSESIR